METLKRLSGCLFYVMLPDECHFREYIIVNILRTRSESLPFGINEGLYVNDLHTILQK